MESSHSSNRPANYKTSTIDKKLEIVKTYYDMNKNASECGRLFGIHHSTVMRYVRKEFQLNANSASKVKRNLHYGRRCEYPELENELFHWIISRRLDLKRPVRSEDIQKRALKIVKDTQPDSEFKASKGWLHNFMERYNLSSRSATHRVNENKTSKESKTIQVLDYLTALNSLVQDYPPQLILQMDEMPTYVDMSENQSVNANGSKSIEIPNNGHLKTRFTTVLTIAADGTRLPTFIILRKQAKPSSVKASPNVIITSSDSGFMDQYTMVEYIDRVVKPYAKSEQALLVLDDFVAHKCPFVLDYFKGRNYCYWHIK